MLLNKIHSFFSEEREKQESPKNTQSALVLPLEYIRENYSNHNSHFKATAIISGFLKMPEKEQESNFTATYLQLEKTILQTSQGLTKVEIREALKAKFEALTHRKDFELIFFPEASQEILLCKRFLRIVWEIAKEQVTFENNSEFVKTENLLNPFLELIGIHERTGEQRKELETAAVFINKAIEKTLGLAQLKKLYTAEYNQFAKTYSNLDAFVSVLHLLPQEVLASGLTLPEGINLSSFLLSKIHHLQEKNDLLSEELKKEKYLEKLINEQEQLKSKILDTTPDALILINESAEIISWNKTSENILGWNASEAIGAKIDTIFSFNNLSIKLKRELKEFIKTGNSKFIKEKFEEHIKNKAGIKIEVEIYIAPILSSSGYLFSVSLRDVTLKKFIDKGMRDAKIIAEKTAEAKSVFLSNMSHEIRTPLNVILGLTSVLQKDTFNNTEITKENINGIKFSAENLLNIVNDILDFSKIEAGKLTLQATDFNLHQLIANLSRGFEIKACEKGLGFKVEVGENVPKYLIGDPYRLNQILTNLLGNALKFTNTGEVSIKVENLTSENGRTFIGFTVNDTGIGIPQDKLHHIFGSFYQVETPCKTKIEGTGLGLTISRQLIELHGGKLSVSSKVGEGSSFRFEVWYHNSSITNENNLQTTCPYSAPDFSGLKILVVEDNKMNQFYLNQVLNHWGVETVLADDGKIAVEIMQQENFDLVLMDFQMPVMNGLEATKHIRNAPEKYNNTPIIMCSANVFPEAREQATLAGANFYLNKPIDEEALKQILIGFKTNNPSFENVKEHNSIPENSVAVCNENILEEGINLEVLKKTLSNDEDTLKTILQIFIEETPQELNELRLLISRENTKQTRFLAHKLKSSFKSLGATAASSILQEIESKPGEACNDKRLEKLQLYFNRAVQEAVAYIKQLN